MGNPNKKLLISIAFQRIAWDSFLFSNPGTLSGFLIHISLHLPLFILPISVIGKIRVESPQNQNVRKAFLLKEIADVTVTGRKCSNDSVDYIGTLS